MARPVNPYQESIKGMPLGAPGAWIAQAEARARTFEEGVDAGRKWGHEEKDEKWREAICKVLAAHTEGITYGGKRIIAVEHIEALL